jgi:branched-chain amino acid transport system substrate-binding protein
MHPQNIRGSLARTLLILTALLTTLSMQASAADIQVKVGFAAPLTGAQADHGKDIQHGVQLALNEANASKMKIGGKTVKFVIQSEDDQADPRVAVQVAQRLVDDNVAVVIGHFNSGAAIPASRIYHAAGIPMIAPSASNPTVTNQGFDNVFTTISNDAQNVGNAGKYAVLVTKAKRIAIIDDRTAFGQGEADEFEQAVKKAGGNIVGREFCTAQTLDFSTQLTSIKGTNADLIFIAALDPLAAAVAKRMKQLGMSAQLVGGGAVMNSEFLKLAGDSADGVMAWEYGRPLASTPEGKTFEGKFKQAFGMPVLAYSPFYYDATWAAIHAMQNADSADPKVYLPELRKVSFEGVTGPIAFNSKGGLKSGSSTLYKVKDGAWVVVETKGSM